MTDAILNDKITALSDLVASLDRPEEWADTPLDRVQSLQCIVETAASALRQAVPEAHRAGASWEKIGKMLGVTRQSAHERYGDL